MSKINQLQEIIDSSENIVFFGGAGVSTESGIPDFRSESGIFKSLEKYGDTPENLISHTYYMDHTEEFFDYYKDTLVFKDAKPNPAHFALAKLEETGKLKAVLFVFRYAPHVFRLQKCFRVTWKYRKKLLSNLRKRIWIKAYFRK